MRLRSLFLLAELLAFGVPAHSYAHARRYSKRTIEGLLLTGIPHDHRSYALRSADMQVRFKVCKAKYPKKVSAVRPMRAVNVAAPAPEAAGGPNTASASTIVNKALGTSKTWTLVQAYSGNTFFNGWNFYTGIDPMNGTVQYLDKSTAASKNLTRFSNGQAILSVETAASIAGNRKSVRLESQLNFTGGLVVIDVAHVPQGCGTSSMLFSYGPEWPKSGEINVIQGFNDLSVNSAAIHTVSGCSLPTADISSLGVYKANLTGSMNCNTLVTGSNGCMLRDAQSGSSGAALNAAVGGVYTMIWVDQRIQVWFFPRNSIIPADLAAGTLHPGSWNNSHLKGFWPAPSCNVRSLFKHHKLALYTTFCGYAAGGQWKTSNALGQSSSCAARTGYTSCEEYVKKRGGDFANAYWSIRYVRVYA